MHRAGCEPSADLLVKKAVEDTPNDQNSTARGRGQQITEGIRSPLDESSSCEAAGDSENPVTIEFMIVSKARCRQARCSRNIASIIIR